MNDLRKRLEFNNVIVQSQATSKLVKILKSKYGSSFWISDKTQHTEELSVLWDLYQNDSTVLVFSDILYQLVIQRLADPVYVIERLVPLLSTTRKLSCVVSTIGKVTIFILSTNEDSAYVERFGNPFTKILQACPQHWRLVHEQIISLQSSAVKSVQQLVISPVILYVLCHPKPSIHLIHFRNHLLSAITEEKSTFKYVIQYICWLKLSSVDDVVQNISILQDLASNIVERDDPPENSLYVLSISMLSLVETVYQFDQDVNGCLQAVVSLTNADNKNNNCDVLIVVLCDLISTLPQCFWKELLILIDKLTDNYSYSSGLGCLLVYPILQILFCNTSDSMLKRTAKKIRTKVEDALIHKKEFKADDDLCCAVDSYICIAQRISQLTNQLCNDRGDSKTCCRSLDDLYCIISSNGINVKLIPNIVTSVLMHHLDDVGITTSCLKIVDAVARNDPNSALCLLPVVLDCLDKSKHPDIKFKILQTLPSVATHKYSITPVVKTLLALCKVQNLRPIVMKLMTSLWMKQDRCFVHLLRLIENASADVIDGREMNEIILVKAACIKTICEHNPAQYGEDVLPIISAMINNRSNDSSVCALCVRSIYCLCKAEVIDVVTTWKFLAPRFRDETNGIILKEIFNLLSLVPEIDVRTQSYEKFKFNVLMLLWKYTVDDRLDNDVKGNAYKAIAKFDVSAMTLQDLPEKTVECMKESSGHLKSASEKFQAIDELSLCYIPGNCFINLLTSMEDHVLMKGYGDFLASVLIKEVVSLPRSAYRPNMKFMPKDKTSAVLDMIPPLLSQMYNRQHHLYQDNLAYSVLLTYQVVYKTKKGTDEPTLNSLVFQAKEAQHTLSQIVGDLSLEMTDWRKFVFISNAWKSFMNKVFTTSVDGRKAELEIQKVSGTLKCTDAEFSSKLGEASLWVRDHLIEILDVSSKGKPSSQANALLALANLLIVSADYMKILNVEEKAALKSVSNRVPQNQLLVNVMETVLSILNPKHRTSEKIIPWLKNVSLGSSNNIITCTSALAVSTILPYLPVSSERIVYIIKLFSNRLGSEESNHVSNFYFGLALGMFIPQMYKYCGIESSDLRLVHKLRTMCVTDGNFKEGKFYGLTIAVSYLCSQSDQKCVDFIKSLHGQLMSSLKCEDLNSMDYESLAVCTANVTSLALSSKIIQVNSAEHLLVLLDERRLQSSKCRGTAAALGILLRNFVLVGHDRASLLRNNMLRIWMRILADEKRPTLERMAALSGLGSLYGIESFVLPELGNSEDVNSGLPDVLNVFCQLVQTCNDIGFRNTCIWMFSLVYKVNGDKSTSCEPVSYAYLPEKSVLRSVVDVLSHFKELKLDHVLVCLKALSECSISLLLPPVDWNVVLSQILSGQSDEEIIVRCVNILIGQREKSSSAQTLLNPFFTPTTFFSLSIDVQRCLLNNLNSVGPAVPVNAFKSFLQSIVSNFAINHPLYETAVENVMLLMKMSDPPQGFLSMIYEFARSIYDNVNRNPGQVNVESLTRLYGRLLAELPTESLHEMCALKTDTDVTLNSMITFELISNGTLNLNDLMPYLNILHTCDSRPMLKSLMIAMVKIETERRSKHGPKWLENLMGKMHHSCKLATSNPKVIESMFSVFVTTVVAWGDECYRALIVPDDISLQQLLYIFPHCLVSLMKKDILRGLHLQIFHFLITLYECRHINDSTKHFIKIGICSFKNIDEVANSNLWIAAAEITCR